jgi:2-polyprenyl-6-methoxyphenol hydroxylase-like FAD-dependent oxidoreductase
MCIVDPTQQHLARVPFDVLVAADGANSVVRQSLNISTTLLDALAIGDQVSLRSLQLNVVSKFFQVYRIAGLHQATSIVTFIPHESHNSATNLTTVQHDERAI